mmetsp:Transcript_22696/g.25225  ORF Transcript_22696/g.25225 Transcript_22696/m.25225 type:complete len:126 (+) Transcript_22696:294-671(+)
MKADESLEVFDMTNVNAFLIRPIGYTVQLPFTNYRLTDGKGILPKLKSVKSFNGNLFLLNFSGGNTTKAVLYECLTPIKPREEGFELLSLKFPMFAITFILVLVIQFIGKKDGEDNNILSILFRF